MSNVRTNRRIGRVLPPHGSTCPSNHRLTQSEQQHVDYDFIYNSWDALSAGIADKIRSCSVRIDTNTGFATIEEKDELLNEKTPLIHPSSGESGGGLKVNLLKRQESKRNGISWYSVAFGLANASIGVGILNYPFLYNRIGGIEFSSLIQLALIACLFLSMAVIIYCSDLHDSCSYHEVLSSICGPKAKILVAADIAAATFGICIAYLVIIGDQYDRMFASLVGTDFCSHWYLHRRFTIALTGLAIFPICLLKRLDFLRHTGPLGIVSMLYVVFLTVYQYYKLVPSMEILEPMSNNVTVNETVPVNIVETNTSSYIFQILSCIPVILFGYQCNEVIVPIYASLKSRNFQNFAKASLLAYSVLIVLYCTVGSFGLMTFGSKVSPNIIMMFDATDPLILIGICALIFKMVVTYPQMAFAGREAYIGIVKEFSKKSLQEFNDDEVSRRYKSTTVWFITSLVIAAFAPHIGIVLQLLGILATTNVFICPSLCLIFLCARPVYSSRVKAGFLITAFSLISMGLVFFVFVIWQVYLDISAAIRDGSSSICTA